MKAHDLYAVMQGPPQWTDEDADATVTFGATFLVAFPDGVPWPPAAASISHSGLSHPTARSVFPRTVNVQINSRLPKSAGTLTLKSRRLNRE